MRAELVVSPRASTSKRAEAVGSLHGLGKTVTLRAEATKQTGLRFPREREELQSAEWAPLDECPDAGTPQCASNENQSHRILIFAVQSR